MRERDQNRLVGYGVVRASPDLWHLAGIFGTRTEAEAKAFELGDGYDVRYGECLDSEFVSIAEPNSLP